MRTAAEDDLPVLLRLLAQLHPLYPGEPRSGPGVFRRIQDEAGRTLLVATRADAIIGTADLLIVPKLGHAGRPWAIAENVVDEDGRGPL